MSANPTALMPATTAVESTRVFKDEWAIRYGVLMGGTKLVRLDGIGQYWVGHHEIPRRGLVGFTRQQVRGRNEAADTDALDQPGGGLLTDPSPLDSKRLIDKSPALCMREMIQMHGAKGFVNSQTLMGDESTADQIFNVVLPANIAALPLVDVIEYLQDARYIGKSFLADNLKARAEMLREELLQGGFIARDFMVSYTSAISEEISQSAEKKTGKRAVDAVDREYFWELKKPLPEDRPQLATMALGREIAGALNTGGNRNDDVLAAMMENNRLLAEQNELQRQRLDKLELGAKARSKTSD